MKYSIIERIGSKVLYVTTKNDNWIDLLNETNKDKKYAAKYNTKQEAIEAMDKFVRNAGSMYTGILDVKGIRD